MNNFSAFINGPPKSRPMPIPAHPGTKNIPPPVVAPPVVDEIVFDTEYIIAEKPPIKDVREFFRENLRTIRSDEQKMFEGTC